MIISCYGDTPLIVNDPIINHCGGYNRLAHQMKIVKIITIVLGGLILLVVGVFALFIITYQRIINEESVIADKQCLVVNPLMVERKNSYMKSMAIMMAEGDPKEYWDEQERYMAISKKYISAQNSWLQEQEELMDRWYYKLIVPQLVKDAGRYQYQARKAEMEGTRAVVQMFTSLDNIERQKELTNTVTEENKKKDVADKAYNHIWDTAPKNIFWMRFITIPPSTCPPENFNIPDTNDIFKPRAPAGDGPLTYSNANG